MPYTTQQDIEDEVGSPARLVELTDRANTGALDVAALGVLSRVQASADGWIDSRLRKFSASDLAALRTAPTATINRIARRVTVIFLRMQMPMGISESETKELEMIATELGAIGRDDARAADTKTARASFIENDGEVSRKKWGW